MNLRDFLQVKREGMERGGFAIIQDEKIPMNCITFVGDGAESALVSWDYGLAPGLGEMVAESMEFLQRTKRIQVVALGCNPKFFLILSDAIAAFADPDSIQEIVEDDDDDV